MASRDEVEAAMKQLQVPNENIGVSVGRTFGILLPLQAQREAEIKTAIMEEHQYGPHERQTLDCFLPKDSSKKSPVLVFVHGGGFSQGDKRLSPAVHANLGQFFSSRGFVTLVINYRLVGKHDAQFPSGGQDLSQALQWLTTSNKVPQADLNNVFIIGNSAGGVHLATFLYGPDAAPKEVTFKSLNQINGLRVAAGIMLGVPCHFGDPVNDGRSDVLEAYWGSRARSYEYDVIRLRQKSKDNTPILMAWSEFDPEDEIMGSVREYLEMHKNGSLQGIDQPEEFVLKGQNHIAPPMTLGLGGSADTWGEELVSWMQNKVNV